MADSYPADSDALWQRRLERERAARLEAEALLEQKSRELFTANQQLAALNQQLEAGVEARTRELAEARDRALAASRTKTDFVAMISHEIRTPMNAILGYAQLLTNAQLDTRLQGYVGKVQQAAQNLLGIINDVLDFAKIEAGKLSTERRVFNLPAQLERLAGLFAELIAQKGLTLNIDFDPSLPRLVTGDPVRLNQVLTNLLNNAIKFSERGTILIRVRAGDGDRCEFSCIDQGPGISPERMAQLFQPFSQTDNSISRRYGGTGLGLAICRQLVELMGGEIGVDSIPGEGANFYFSLPLPAAQTDAEQDQAFSEQVCLFHARNRLLGKHLLLVEDNALNRELAVELLEERGAMVSVAVDGESALRQLQQHSVDLVLMDVQMPGMDGMETTRRLRQELGLTELPVVAMTANVSEEDRAQCEAAGMNGFIGKPFAIEQLVLAIGNALWQQPAGEGTVAAAAEAAGPKVLDPAAGLRLVAGNQRIYQRILGMFIDRHAQGAFTLSQQGALADPETAARTVHSMKGLSGSIGAPLLHAAAVTLDQGFKERAVTEAMVRDYQAALDAAATAVTQWLAEQGEA